jgi:Flp pilus assembly protein CpaB
MEVNMRRGRIFIYLALILLLGLVAVAVVWMRSQKPASASEVVEATPTPFVDLANVIVATQRIQRGSVINEEVLGTIPIQRELLVEGYFTDLRQVVGHKARVDLEANMLLTNSMIVDSAENLSATGSNAALQIPRGMVAVSIPISRLASVSYAPQAGDHVNVIATLLLVDLDTEYQTLMPNNTAAVLAAGPGVILGVEHDESNSTSLYPDLVKITAQNSTGGTASVFGRAEIDPLLAQTFYVVPSERQRPRLLSQTLLQDVVVLGLGNFPLDDKKAEAPTVTPEVPAPIEGEVAPSPQATAQPEAPEPLPDVITLIVTPQDAVTLNYMVYSGAQLTLALRASGDDTLVVTEATSLDFLMRQYNIPMPLSLPYGVEPRVDELAAPRLPNDGPQPTPMP